MLFGQYVELLGKLKNCFGVYIYIYIYTCACCVVHRSAGGSVERQRWTSCSVTALLRIAQLSFCQGKDILAKMQYKALSVLAGVVVCTLALPVPSGRCISCI